MQKAVTIFLVVLMGSLQTPLGQFLKLPLLVEHFIKHQDRDGASVIGFLEEHYLTTHNDTDLPEDEQLPFKNISFYNIGYAIVTPIIQTEALATLPIEKQILFSVVYTSQQHLSSIFHPPKV